MSKKFKVPNPIAIATTGCLIIVLIPLIAFIQLIIYFLV